MERVLTALSHKEPDRVPLFLLLSMYGAKELGMTVRDYFMESRNVIEAQLRMTKKYDNDCYYGFSYAAAEVEAWGGELLFSDDGPPNAGEPIINRNSRIDLLTPPKIKECKNLVKVLNSIEGLKQKVGDSKPIIGVVMAPFSLPVMQLGFEYYLEVMLEKPEQFDHLMRINEAFCVDWANAQLEAGATAICYFDPVSSPSIIPKELYHKLTFPVSKRTLAQIKGPTATHMASGHCMPIIDGLAQTGTHIVCVSSRESIKEIKEACKDQLTVLGNLNGIEMCNWSSGDAEIAVKDIIRQAGKGGGLILSDNHGEIPLQVNGDVLLAISEATKKWGKYPLNWL